MTTIYSYQPSDDQAPALSPAGGEIKDDNPKAAPETAVFGANLSSSKKDSDDAKETWKGNEDVEEAVPATSDGSARAGPSNASNADNNQTSDNDNNEDGKTIGIVIILLLIVSMIFSFILPLISIICTIIALILASAITCQCCCASEYDIKPDIKKLMTGTLVSLALIFVLQIVYVIGAALALSSDAEVSSSGNVSFGEDTMEGVNTGSIVLTGIVLALDVAAIVFTSWFVWGRKGWSDGQSRRRGLAITSIACIAAVGVIAGVLASIGSGQSNPSPTSETIESDQILTPTPTVFAPLDGYEYVGKGDCLASKSRDTVNSNKGYDAIYVLQKDMTASDCGELCGRFRSVSGFRGLRWGPNNYRECRCYFDTDRQDICGQTQADVCPTLSELASIYASDLVFGRYSYDRLNGVGEISTSVEMYLALNHYCYKVIRSTDDANLPQSPSDTESNSPLPESFDPSNIHFCGRDYFHASDNCLSTTPCPPGQDHQCPSGQACYAGIVCEVPLGTIVEPAIVTTTEEPESDSESDSIKRGFAQVLEVKSPARLSAVQLGIYCLLMQSYTAQIGLIVWEPDIKATCKVINQDIQSDSSLLAVQFTMEYKSDVYDISSYPDMFMEYINNNPEQVLKDMAARFLPVIEVRDAQLTYQNADSLTHPTHSSTEPMAGPGYCTYWLNIMVSSDVDGSGGLSEREFYTFLSNIDEPEYIADYFQGYDNFYTLPWPFRVVHKSLSCHCEIYLGHGDGCCEGDAELLLEGLDGTGSSEASAMALEQEYRDRVCEQLRFVIDRTAQMP